MADDPNSAIRELVDRWCERRELWALATLLPAWLGNNGLTDGWQALSDALRHTCATEGQLPQDERETLKRLYVAVDESLRHR
jgi:hypothetical protein